MFALFLIGMEHGKSACISKSCKGEEMSFRNGMKMFPPFVPELDPGITRPLRRYNGDDPFDDNDNTERNSFIDNVFRDPADPAPGTVILCDLSPLPGLSLLNLNAEHTGIYVGNGNIIHRSGNGYLEIVKPREFLERLGGKNWAISVYVACNGTKSLTITEAANRAQKALKNPSFDGYDILNQNCHHLQ